MSSDPGTHSGTPGPTADLRWRAVIERDTRQDGRFVYAVESTGIYCRPGCPSRRPRRDRVRFFDDPATAAAAGFRACRRCHPETGADPTHRKMLDVCRRIDASSGKPPSLDELATASGLSPAHLQRTFKRVIGVSPREYADTRRVSRVRAGLRAGRSILDVLYDAGWGSTSRLYERAAGRLGMTPRAYQRGAPGLTVRYATVSTRLGVLLVAATPRGVCRVDLGDDVARLETALREELPEAELRIADPPLRAALEDLARYVEGAVPWPRLPIDLRGTAFECRVWAALREIPVGETVTYGDLARRLGAPRAARAVANACARNPAPLAVPCHRVVPAHGRDAGGYRLGRPCKQALLDAEAAHTPKEQP